MSRKKVLLFLGISALIAIVILISLIVTMFTSSNSKPPVIAAPTPQDQLSNPDYEKDPFDNHPLEIQTLIQNFNFAKPVIFKDAIEDRTGAILVQSTKNYLLFQAFQKTYYLYDIVNKKRIVINKNITTAYLSPNEDYVYYGMEYAGKQSIRYFRIKDQLDIGELIEIPGKSVLKQIVVSKGALFYTFILSGKRSSDLFILPEFKGKYVPAQQKMSLDNAYIFLNGDQNFYTCQNGKSSIDQIQLGINTIPKYQTKQIINNIIKCSVNNGNWFSFSGDYNTAIAVNSSLGKIDDEKHTLITQIDFIDKNNLLILNEDVLYVYNIQTKEYTVLRAYVLTYQKVDDYIYIQSVDGPLEVIQIKKAG
jgi:hypothetical protein